MSDPWFKRFGYFGYVPINWKGRLTLIAMLAAFTPAAALFLFLPENAPILRWVFAVIAFGAVAAGHALVLLHMASSERR